MSKGLVIAGALAGSLMTPHAFAMPGATGTHMQLASAITTVDYACGRGWHLTEWGAAAAATRVGRLLARSEALRLVSAADRIIFYLSAT